MRHSKSVVGLQGTVLPNRTWGSGTVLIPVTLTQMVLPLEICLGRDKLGIISHMPRGHFEQMSAQLI